VFHVCASLLTLGTRTGLYMTVQQSGAWFLGAHMPPTAATGPTVTLGSASGAMKATGPRRLAARKVGQVRAVGRSAVKRSLPLLAPTVLLGSRGIFGSGQVLKV
jgi:hypothetical protein